MTLSKYLGIGLILVLVTSAACTESSPQTDQSSGPDNHQASTDENNQSANTQGTIEPANTSQQSPAESSQTQSVESSHTFIENTYTDQYGNVVYTIVDEKPAFKGGGRSFISNS